MKLPSIIINLNKTKLSNYAHSQKKSEMEKKTG